MNLRVGGYDRWEERGFGDSSVLAYAIRVLPKNAFTFGTPAHSAQQISKVTIERDRDLRTRARERGQVAHWRMTARFGAADDEQATTIVMVSQTFARGLRDRPGR